MKKSLAVSLLFFGLCAFAHAEDRDRDYPFPGIFPIRAPAISSCTNANSSLSGANLVLISSTIVLLSVEVVNPGSADATFSIYETVGTASTMTYTRRYGPINTSAKFDFEKSIPLESTVTISNGGTTPATVCMEFIPWGNKK